MADHRADGDRLPGLNQYFQNTGGFGHYLQRHLVGFNDQKRLIYLHLFPVGFKPLRQNSLLNRFSHTWDLDFQCHSNSQPGYTRNHKDTKSSLFIRVFVVK